ncbi:hypothetical protein ACFE04_024471 [Oxalis oulophora]
MMQTVVIQLEIHDHGKRRSKAMEICAAAHGVVKVELIGSNNNVVAVTGDGVDWFGLALKLRKKLGEEGSPTKGYNRCIQVDVEVEVPALQHKIVKEIEKLGT